VKLNDQIVASDIKLFQETAKLNDEELIDKEKRITMKFKQEFSQISIDINIAKSKIESLENLQQMNIGQL